MRKKLRPSELRKARLQSKPSNSNDPSESVSEQTPLLADTSLEAPAILPRDSVSFGEFQQARGRTRERSLSDYQIERLFHSSTVMAGEADQHVAQTGSQAASTSDVGFDPLQTRGTLAETPQEDKMTPEEAIASWNRIFAEARATTGADKRAVRDGVLSYLIMNGTSPRAPFRAKLRCGGAVFDTRMLPQCTMGRVRPFGRAHADIMRDMVETSAKMPEWGRKNGMPLKFLSLGFDCSDACSNLSDEETAAIARVKEAAVTRTRYDSVRGALKFGGNDTDSSPAPATPTSGSGASYSRMH